MAQGADDSTSPQREDRTGEPVPISALAFSLLSLLVEAGAARLGAPTPADAAMDPGGSQLNLDEAKLAIDAANALLGAVRRALSNDELIAIEGVLTQLQVEYVKKVR